MTVKNCVNLNNTSKLSQYMSSYIYCITNLITNQRYIGKTELTIEKRFKKHKSNAIKGHDTYLYRSMRKYGIDNFSIDIVETTTKEFLSFKESYHINLLKPELNMTAGGDGGSTTHNRMWINNGIENKYILKGDNIPEGFVIGRICKFNDPEFQSEMGKRAQSKINFSKRCAGNEWNNKSTELYGIKYKSRKHAMESLGISKHKLYRLLNDFCNS